MFLTKIILKLKSSQSTGVDNISTKIFKECADVLSIILPIFINRSFETEIFSDCLKIAKVVPIFKKMDLKMIWQIIDQYPY